MPDQSTLDPHAILAGIGVTGARQVEPIVGQLNEMARLLEAAGKDKALAMTR